MLLSLLAFMVQGAWATSVAQAVLLNDKTMHFLYGDQLTEGGTYNTKTITEVWNIPYEVTPGWYNNDAVKSVTTVTFDDSFASYCPTDCGYWFLNFNALKTIENIQNLHTEKVASMYDMFANCWELTTLDLTYFDTSNVTDMRSMFANCPKLTTITVSSGWTTDNVDYSADMFNGCTNLKGGNGTEYSAEHINKDYAHVDGGTGNPGYLTLTTADIVMLTNNADNAAVLTTYGGKTKTVMLSGRTLYKDGYWNTICLPFAVSAAQIATSTNPLYGATIKELSASGTTLSSTTLTLTLAFTDVDAITAGKPYIIKWDSGTNLVNPTFSGVTISNTAAQTITSTDNNVNFVGSYAPFDITSDNIDNILYIGSANKIGYAMSERKLKTCRAHFSVPTTAGARAVSIINFDDGEQPSAIQLVQSEDVNNGDWYTLEGRRLTSRPTAKGIYIHQGKKEVIK